MPYYIATVSAKWLKENTVIYSFDADSTNKKAFSEQEMTKANLLHNDDEEINAGPLLKQVQAFSTESKYCAAEPFPIAYQTFEKENLFYLQLRFDHPFSMRLSAYGDNKQYFKTPLQLKRGDNNHLEQVDIEGQEAVTLKLLTIQSLSGNGVFTLAQGAFFNNRIQVNNFKKQFNNLIAYFNSQIFKGYKIHICISEVGQKKFSVEREELQCKYENYRAVYERIMAKQQEIESLPPAMQVTKLQKLLNSLRIPELNRVELQPNQSLDEIRHTIENYSKIFLDLLVKYEDISLDTQTYEFASPSQKHSLAVDNSRWHIIVFPPGIGMSLIENTFEQTLSYSRKLIEQAEQEEIIPPVLPMPEPIYGIFSREIQMAAEFKNQIQIQVEKKEDEYLIHFSGNVLVSAIEEYLPKTNKAIQNYNPNELLPPPAEQEGYLSKIVGFFKKQNELPPPPAEQESYLSKIGVFFKKQNELPPPPAEQESYPSKIGGLFKKQNEGSPSERTPLLGNGR
ncbi:hypothetical protein ACFORL_08290 [Legionella dresdenensis]|uniref:Dot/Icm T4SS effector n=1 Tax=Legionella dresdenensis TaxID=450200 RepID=A0ABV8CFY9_9GAMM